ncbi:Sec1-binding region of Mso1-domain-containing protein [Xylogone sp. PMI_703]|nr:Sec1-binding region of Mso1-domain-containing protein [Xylogone sp. PMI_703]
MTSYFSSLLTTTSSRVASIRQNLLPSENDGDTEDDTHLCRVLRAYYIEKGRIPFPSWLPPDPKAPPPTVIQPVYNNAVGSRYGGLQQGGGPGGAGSSGLSSLWDPQAAPAAQQDPQSLRRGARGGGAAGAAVNQRPNPFMSRQAATPVEQVQARPLPSQRAGSYQTAGGAAGAFGRATSPQPPASSGGRSAQEKLKDRFRTAAKSATGSSASSVSSDGGGGGKFMSTVQAARQNSFGNQGSSGGGGGGGDKPYMSATAPWSGGGDEYSAFSYGGGGGYDDGGRSGGRQGLPSNLQAGSGRRGPGLPSGPRGLR